MPQKESDIFGVKVGKQQLMLKRQAEVAQQFLDAKTKAEIDHLHLLEKAHEESSARLKKLEETNRKTLSREEQVELDKRIKKQKSIVKTHQNEVAAHNKKLVDAQRKYKEQADAYAEKVELTRYRAMTATKKFEYQKSLQDELKAEQKTLADKIKATEQAWASEKDIKKKAALSEDLTNLKDQEARNNEKLNNASKRVSALGLLPQNRKQAMAATQESIKANVEKKAEAKASAKSAQERLKDDAKLLDIEKQIRQAKKSGNDNQLESLKKLRKEHLEQSEEGMELLRAEQELKEANHELNKESMKELAQNTAQAVSNLGSNIMKKASDSIEGNLDAMFGSQGKMMGRLQGLRDANNEMFDWAETVDKVSDTIGFSGVVSKKSVVAKMVELVDSGVAYNLEMRAFLAETSENIAATFSATNGTLLRLIRIQQSDSTAARLGMEAMLTKTLNQMFEDTAYLADSVSDSVSQAILDLSATTSRENAVELEFILQKWLGALYSLGLSSEAVTKIAQGINYLGTGNVGGITGDSALTTLFGLSATRLNGAKSFDQMLTDGLTASDTNKLLRSMVELLSEIASSQENYVTKSAYADVFGMSLTDLNTFTSLTKEEIESLFNLTSSYKSMFNETESQLSQISKRVSFSKLVDTAIDNALVGAASTIGSNGVTYGTWKTLSLLKDYVGEIKVPGILAFGSGISSGLDLLNIAQTALVGMGLLGSLLGGLDSMMSGGPTNLANWNFNETTTRGNTLSVLNFGDAFASTSYSAKIGVGSKSAKDVEAVSIQSGADDAYDAGDTSSAEIQESKELPQKIYDALAGDSTPTILSVLQEIDDRLDPGRVFYTAITGMLSSDAVSQVTNLSTQLADVKSTMYTSGIVDNATQTKPYGSQLSSNYGYNGTFTNTGEQEHSISMETIIANAVETALRNVAGYSAGSGLPVTITNSTGYGG